MHGTTVRRHDPRGLGPRPLVSQAPGARVTASVIRSTLPVLSGVLVAGLVLAGSLPAAASGGGSDPAGLGVVYLSAGTSASTQLFAADRSGSPLAFSPLGPSTPQGSAYQGLAFRASDRSLYAVQGSTSTDGPHLLAIDGDGATTRLGALTSLAPDDDVVSGATFGEGAWADVYLAVVRDRTASSGTHSLLSVEISAGGTLTETTTPVDLPAGSVLGDLAAADDYLWAVYGQEIVRIDPTDGSTASWTLPGGTVGPGADTVYGVAWSTGSGQITVGSYQHGEVTGIRVSGPASDTPTFTVVARDAAPIDLHSDGTYAPPPQAGAVTPPETTEPTTVPPDAPEIDPTDGTRVAGTGVPGHTITVTFPDGSTARATVGDDGRWTVPTPRTTFVHGHLLEATATDPAGATSDPGCTTVDLIGQP